MIGKDSGSAMFRLSFPKEECLPKHDGTRRWKTQRKAEKFFNDKIWVTISCWQAGE
ncbi:MAG: hypothetical protein Q8941_07275 [Bacteroidota bacterium]|nr:hypothetical protein [Bacteroidota bacterium]